MYVAILYLTGWTFFQMYFYHMSHCKVSQKPQVLAVVRLMQ